jgi:hypothetical protein
MKKFNAWVIVSPNGLEIQKSLSFEKTKAWRNAGFGDFMQVKKAVEQGFQPVEVEVRKKNMT